MAKANQRKNAKRPSPRGKKPVEGSENRAKAKSLFDKWTDDQTIIQLSKGFLGIRFIGKLDHFSTTNDDEHYVFRTGFGIRADFPLIIYDKISVDSSGLGSSTPVVTLECSRFPNDNENKWRLVPLEGASPTKEEIERAMDQFRLWAKVDSALWLIKGDSQHFSVSTCKISKLDSQSVILLDDHAKAGHVIAPFLSDAIDIKKQGDATHVTLHVPHSYISVIDREESAEELIRKFPLLSRSIQ
jgi:hypothetical protein